MSEEKKLYSTREVARAFGVSERTICRIVREGFVSPRQDYGNRRFFSDEDLERIRTILVLSRDLGVNWAGVEVVLHLRERLLCMHEQIDQIFTYIHRQVRDTLLEEQDGPPPRKRRRMDLVAILDEEDE